MRPIRLTIKAFGPYAEETVIDFEKLDGRRLFLICGPTGAGKTTILDAMCYALYGKTSGDRDGKNMRSDYADTSVRTEVTFDFALGNHVYRAYRSPEQLLDKKRGSGQTVSAMQSSLSELKDGKEIHTIEKGVEEAATRLIGLNAGQFCQVILLPQGDFRKLLIAKADEREAILKQLFKTKRFSDFQDRLKDRFHALMNKKKEEETALSSVLQMEKAENEKELRSRKDAAAQEGKDAGRLHEELERKYGDFRKIFEKALLLSNHFEALEKALSEKNRLLAQKDSVTQKEEDLSKIRKTRELSPYFDALEKTIQEGKKANQEKSKADALRQKEQTALKELQQQASALDLQRPGMEKDRQALAVMKEQIPRAKEYGQAAEALQHAEKAEKQAALQRKKLAEAGRKAQAEQKKREDEALSLRRDYIFGQAAILARQLKEGERCPVCGAVHHPLPAVSDRPLPTEEKVRQAEQNASRAAEEARKAAEAFTRFEGTDWLQVQNALSAARTRIASLADIPERFRDPDILAQEIRKLEKQLSNWDAAQKKNEEDLREASAKLGAAEASYKSADEQRNKLVQDYKQQQEALSRRAQEAGFASPEDCRAWHDRLKEEETLAGEIDRYKADLTSAEKRISEETAQTAGQQKPSVDALRKEDQSYQDRLKQALTVQTEKEKEARRLEEVLRKTAAQAKQLEKTEREVSLVSGLYSLTRGERSRISLERYVLGTLLDEVAKAANLRLREMSRKRYSLRRMSGDSTLGRGGLTLEVSDSYTGRTRPANTLSGGETFLASLALALGLADVVQARQGGVRLDTMFIDEGFGTLDPDSLNSAMNTLIDLQSTGRLVGIISHVPELEERIDARLRVRTGKKGSTAAFEVE